MLILHIGPKGRPLPPPDVAMRKSSYTPRLAVESAFSQLHCVSCSYRQLLYRSRLKAAITERLGVAHLVLVTGGYFKDFGRKSQLH
jgi:hypothetical protein